MRSSLIFLTVVAAASAACVSQFPAHTMTDVCAEVDFTQTKPLVMFGSISVGWHCCGVVVDVFSQNTRTDTDYVWTTPFANKQFLGFSSCGDAMCCEDTNMWAKVISGPASGFDLFDVTLGCDAEANRPMPAAPLSQDNEVVAVVYGATGKFLGMQYFNEYGPFGDCANDVMAATRDWANALIENEGGDMPTAAPPVAKPTPMPTMAQANPTPMPTAAQTPIPTMAQTPIPTMAQANPTPLPTQGGPVDNGGPTMCIKDGQCYQCAGSCTATCSAANCAGAKAELVVGGVRAGRAECIATGSTDITDPTFDGFCDAGEPTPEGIPDNGAFSTASVSSFLLALPLLIALLM